MPKQDHQRAWNILNISSRGLKKWLKQECSHQNPLNVFVPRRYGSVQTTNLTRAAEGKRTETGVSNHSTLSSSAALCRSAGIAPSFRNDGEANPALYRPRLTKALRLDVILLTVSGGLPENKLNPLSSSPLRLNGVQSSSVQQRQNRYHALL